MRLGEIWRYPVKSMTGERLWRTVLRADGVPGDRLVHVEDEDENVLTARTRHRLLGMHATLGEDGEPLIDGRPWREVSVQEAAGPRARLTQWDGPERFDVLPLLVATDGAIAAFGHDGRRLRPNLVITGVEGLAEREWEGRRILVGGAIVRLVSLRARCVMTTFDPDTLLQDRDVLRQIVARFGGKLALDAEVERTGPIQVGDPVRLL